MAVDAESYRPLRFRFHAGEQTSDWWRVVLIETIAREEGQFARPAPSKPRPAQLTGSDERTLTPAEAAEAIAWPAVWPGPEVDGIKLTQIELIRLTARWTDGRETRDHALSLRYGGGRHVWFGAMQVGDVYVALESPERSAIISAAKAMRPIG